MGTPEFPNLGKHCFVDECRQIDFLPFTCDCCHQKVEEYWVRQMSQICNGDMQLTQAGRQAGRQAGSQHAIYGGIYVISISSGSSTCVDCSSSPASSHPYPSFLLSIALISLSNVIYPTSSTNFRSSFSCWSSTMATKYIVGSVLASFAVAYVCDVVIADKKVFGGTTPHTVANNEWWKETDKMFQAWPRTAGPPVVMTPISRQNYIVKS